MTQFYENNEHLALCHLEQQFSHLTSHACLWIDTIIDAVQDSVILVDHTYQILMINQVTSKLLGYSEHELLNQSLRYILADNITDISRIEQSLRTNTEVTYLAKNRQPITVSLSSRFIYDDEGDAIAIICIAKDISKEKQMEQLITHSKAALYYDLYHDKLTGLPNRKFFIEQLEQSLKKTYDNENCCFSVLVIDLDQFKLINNSYGHLIGDNLLLQVVERFQKCLHSEVILARLGGDEFGMIINHFGNLDYTLSIVDCLKKDLSLPFQLDGYEVYSSASIGIAIGNANYQKVEEILRDAEAALSQAKMKDKASYTIFHQQMYWDTVNRLELDQDLRRAIERNEFELRYQPIVELNTQQVRGFEVLTRWKHPEKGFIPPADFIPVTEENGLIIPLSNWVFEEACQQLFQWQQISDNFQDITLSLNLSVKQLSQSNLVENVKNMIQEIGINSHHVKLEITESSIMENPEKACSVLNEFKALGIKISLDDFGTGYSSLSYLHRFPIDILKIDRSFIKDITEKTDKLRLTQIIIELANHFGMEVIAEGIETPEQVEQLQQLGCQFGQGYYFDRPLTTEQAKNLILNKASQQKSPLKAMGDGFPIVNQLLNG
ncbi:MAG: putative bifunctional diguanylate cyclase/phosphodiesterase [Microcystaceae cyanobacterium]